MHGLLVETVNVWLVAEDPRAEVTGSDDVRPHDAEPLLQDSPRHLAHTVRRPQGNTILLAEPMQPHSRDLRRICDTLVRQDAREELRL
eukprot:6108883-Alexandrium_andersonii.AAC.1